MMHLTRYLHHLHDLRLRVAAIAFVLVRIQVSLICMHHEILYYLHLWAWPPEAVALCQWGPGCYTVGGKFTVPPNYSS